MLRRQGRPVDEPSSDLELVEDRAVHSVGPGEAIVIRRGIRAGDEDTVEARRECRCPVGAPATKGLGGLTAVPGRGSQGPVRGERDDLGTRESGLELTPEDPRGERVVEEVGIKGTQDADAAGGRFPHGSNSPASTEP